MKLMSESFRFFIEDDSGATAIEFWQYAGLVLHGVADA